MCTSEISTSIYDIKLKFTVLTLLDKKLCFTLLLQSRDAYLCVPYAFLLDKYFEEVNRSQKLTSSLKLFGQEGIHYYIRIQGERGSIKMQKNAKQGQWGRSYLCERSHINLFGSIKNLVYNPLPVITRFLVSFIKVLAQLKISILKITFHVFCDYIFAF